MTIVTRPVIQHSEAEIDQLLTSIDTLSSDALREQCADMMGRSLAAGAIPRHVVMRHLGRLSDDKLRTTLREAITEYRRMMADAEARGQRIVGVGYDAEELERVQAEQRRMK